MDTSFDWIAVRNAVLWLAPTFALPVYCYYISHTRRNLLQHLLWMLGIAMTCMIPMTVTVENSSARWWLSCLSLAMFLKMGHGWALGPRFNSIGEAQFFFLQPMTPPNPLPLIDKSKPRKRMARGALKFLCLVGMAILNSAVPFFRENIFATAFFGMWSTYLIVTGFVDVYSGAVMWVTQWDAGEFVDSPFLSTGPRDFWSRRWNLLFRNVTHACVFTPLKNMGISPLYGVAGVFIISCLVHEYMVLVSSEEHRLLGWMTAFFVIHALATVVNTYVSRNQTWTRLAKNIPNYVWVSIHMAWMALTGPLFFIPALKCIPFMDYTLF